jgi:hypothetical protein
LLLRIERATASNPIQAQVGLNGHPGLIFRRDLNSLYSAKLTDSMGIALYFRFTPLTRNFVYQKTFVRQNRRDIFASRSCSNIHNGIVPRNQVGK